MLGQTVSKWDVMKKCIHKASSKKRIFFTLSHFPTFSLSLIVSGFIRTWSALIFNKTVRSFVTGGMFAAREKDNSWRKCPDVSVPNLFKGIAALFAGCCLSLSLDRDALIYRGNPQGWLTLSTLWRNKYTLDSTSDYVPLCRNCLMPVSANTELEHRALEIADYYRKNISGRTLRQKRCVMSNAVCGEWPKLTAALSGTFVCDLMWTHSSVTSGLEGFSG